MIEVRRAGPDDAAELMRLRAVMLSSVTGPLAPGDDWRHAGVALLHDRLAGDPAPMAAFVVDRPTGDGLAACVVGQVEQRLPAPGDPSGLRGYVHNVATDPAYRRRGYSRACMRALLRWFADRGVPVVELRASAEGEPLYASLGFERTRDPSMRLRAT